MKSPRPRALLDELQEQVSQRSVFSSSERSTRTRQQMLLLQDASRGTAIADSTGGSGVTMLALDYKQENYLLGQYNYLLGQYR